ncbi:MAG: archaeal heat shock protein Hsp20 [Candidatus Bathyarchaeia archaeon]
MSWEEDFPEWFRPRRRRFPFFFEDTFEEMQRMMEEMFKDLTATMPKELIRERKLPEGGAIKEFGPFVYGYSMTIGPDGKPIIREFGNVKPSLTKRGLEVKEEREPLVDTIADEKTVKVIAELPGVDKSDIKLNATEKSLTISVDTEKRKYHKELTLPAEVEPESAKASYKNGVLEVTLNRVKPKRVGKEVKIE